MGFFLLLSITLCLLVSVRLFLYRTTLIHRLKNLTHWVEDRVHVHQTLKVPELDENGQNNMFYLKVYQYLTSLPTIEESNNTKIISESKLNEIVLRLDDNQTVSDTFLGARVSWTNEVVGVQQHAYQKNLILTLKKKDRQRILQSYIQHIYRAASEDKELKIYTNTTSAIADTNIQRWRSVRLSHPATFDTIVMDSDLKRKVRSDLDLFLKSKQYYHKLGRVWKRSYLLYGPSGTGKSSFIAAMAKHLNYDIYEIDLTRVVDDSDLKTLLLQTRRKSVIVVEDLDRFVTSNLNLTNSNKVNITVIGLLNFMDGILNSCCGDEKLMVFTMNNKDKIAGDSSLNSILRPGRIDVHIHFPLCDFNSFKTLANNCLGLKEHKLFAQVEEILHSGSTMSPAEMSEIMIANRGSPGRALKSVITALQSNSNAVMTEDSKSQAETVYLMDGSCSVPVVKEIPQQIQKLYGLLRMKSSRKIGPSDQDSVSNERSR